MAEMSEEALAAYKRAAEAVLAAGHEDRRVVNEQIRAVIADAKEAWPTISDADLVSFFNSQSMLMTSLAHLDIMRLGSAIDLVFRNCTLAAAAVAGAYDVEDDDTPKRDLDEIVAEAKQADKDFNAPGENTGMYL
jgi:hypothetical protein